MSQERRNDGEIDQNGPWGGTGIVAGGDFRPGSIIQELDLKRPIYQKTAAFGHFGRTDKDFTWEQPKMNLKLD